jgi:DNA-binding response OmpR family regulator
LSAAPPTNPLVLIVEDDDELRGLLASGLANRGYRVAVAENGQVGIERLSEEVPRLVILDYWMPVVDGAGFLLQMRDLLTICPPVVLVTAADEDAELIRDLGVDVYVEKPIVLANLFRLVDAMARGARLPIRRADQRLDTERRAFRRRRVEMTARVVFPDGRAVRAQTTDLSEGGILLRLPSASPAPLGVRVDVGLDLPDGRRLDLSARVRHVVGRNVGAQFLVLDPTQSATLHNLLVKGEP